MTYDCPECEEPSKNVGTYFGNPDGPTRLKQKCLNHECWKDTFEVTKEAV